MPTGLVSHIRVNLSPRWGNSLRAAALLKSIKAAQFSVKSKAHVSAPHSTLKKLGLQIQAFQIKDFLQFVQLGAVHNATLS